MIEKQCLGFINTPALWDKSQFGIQQFDFPELNISSFSPKSIPKNIRLGHQMEYVFSQLIQHSHRYTVVVHNLPIIADKRTIGEIDFILRDVETAQLIHVELTYKFYIINTEISEPIHRLMGPNKRDMFFTKMEKIKNQQFPLLHTIEGAKALRAREIDHAKIAHKTCYKTQLFVPYHTAAIHIRPLNKNCICGYWLRFKDFDSDEFRSYSYYLPFKSEWVVSPHNGIHWQSYVDTLMEINLRMLKENAPMVWIKKSETEFEKCFVVWW
ncbi:MAG: DUF1853 family protein [Saonia sp.]